MDPGGWEGLGSGGEDKDTAYGGGQRGEVEVQSCSFWIQKLLCSLAVKSEASLLLTGGSISLSIKWGQSADLTMVGRECIKNTKEGCGVRPSFQPRVLFSKCRQEGIETSPAPV